MQSCYGVLLMLANQKTLLSPIYCSKWLVLLVHYYGAYTPQLKDLSGRLGRRV